MDTISRFNRDTVWLAVGVLGIMVFAAVVLAIQERHAKATQADRHFLLNLDSASLGSAVANSSNADGKMTPGPGSSVDHAFTETPVQEIPSSQMEPPASTPTAVLAFTPEMNRNAHRQESARVSGPKTHNVRNSADVKMRLIELWHQSLPRSEKSRSWTAFSNLNKGVRKKAAYTAKTSH
jgi:uncharacterized protein involved in copper resistance